MQQAINNQQLKEINSQKLVHRKSINMVICCFIQTFTFSFTAEIHRKLLQKSIENKTLIMQ